MRSAPITNPLNEVVVVDNRCNLHFDTLSEAILQGVGRAQYELLVIVHEDVLLLPGWQEQFERSLAVLNASDPTWGLLGVAGWTSSGAARGHWSDPHGYSNYFAEGQCFDEVARIDEQLMVVRKSGPLQFDRRLPSIHNIGRDLARQARTAGVKTYVVDAPTVHKYADAEGKPISRAIDSPKIQGRKSRTYIADKALSDAYLEAKWSAEGANKARVDDFQFESRPPLVLVSRGGSGSRLLATLAQDCGVFIGNELGASGDALEMVHSVYRGVLRKFRYRSKEGFQQTVDDLRASAAAMLAKQPESLIHWGFKLPESILILDEIAVAFPFARYIQLLRDPLETCLRRTHMTARWDNQIGQATLRAAYEHCLLDIGQALDDPPELHMAITTKHQLDLALDFMTRLGPDRAMVVRFEDLIQQSKRVLSQTRAWIGTSDPIQPSSTLLSMIDPERAMRAREAYSKEAAQPLEAVFGDLSQRLEAHLAKFGNLSQVCNAL
ncbi:sulfotransferase family protein [Pseudomarimonas arenosa]|nr:sulfotransferase [Pseudomarimonas arenosa]